MLGPVFWAVSLGAVLLVVAVAVWTLSYAKGRRLGSRGAVLRSRLSCPKCGQAFDYDWVPGASVSAVRLGTHRYLACPQCGKWSTFDVYGSMIRRPAEGSANGAGETPPPPTAP